MPGFLLHVNATVKCLHAGTAIIAPSQPRVVVGGQPVANIAAVTTVAGCPFTVPGPKPQPCVLIKWVMPSTRFLINGQPVALVPNPGPAPGICQSAEQIPQGAPVVASLQMRVVGS
jgi:uncharacterized Zn-binding protein involved in type VI secretion